MESPRYYFNPRSPCGERRLATSGLTADVISIHAPRVGSDLTGCNFSQCSTYFNPRSPCGERLRVTPDRRVLTHFNPRSPCGERLYQGHDQTPPDRIFQSTLPVWGATFPHTAADNRTTDFNPRSPCGERLLDSLLRNYILQISIHAPRVGSDRRQDAVEGEHK